MKGELKKLHLCSHVHVRKISFMYLGYFKSILEILNEMSWIFLFFSSGNTGVLQLG